MSSRRRFVRSARGWTVSLSDPAAQKFRSENHGHRSRVPRPGALNGRFVDLGRYCTRIDRCVLLDRTPVASPVVVEIRRNGLRGQEQIDPPQRSTAVVVLPGTGHERAGMVGKDPILGDLGDTDPMIEGALAWECQSDSPIQHDGRL